MSGSARAALVIVPTYNEAENIERLVEAARDQPEVQLLVDFIPQSTRSLVR